MKVNILTPDSKKPNLAAMKIAAWHRENGDEVFLNFPLIKADFTYASILFSRTVDPFADLIGGPKYPDNKLDSAIDAMKPDYFLYPNLTHSVGYTYKTCPRSCDFCVVPKQRNSEEHFSIWSFHNPKFKKICLLNNNTLADPQWRNTFDEIIDAKLSLIEHGFDARLITDESADYLSRLKFDGYIHLAWDYIEHEKEVVQGLDYLLHAGISKDKIMCYVIMGYNSTEEEDLYRLRVLKEKGILAYAMPYEGHKSKYPPKFLWAINRPFVNRNLDFSGKTYKSVVNQIYRK